MMQLLVVLNDFHWALGHSGTREWPTYRLYVGLGGGGAAAWALFSSKKQHVSSSGLVAGNVTYCGIQQA